MNAVHIKYGTAAMATYLDAAKGFPFPNDSYWGRVWMYAMTGLESGHHVYIEARVAGGNYYTGVRALNTQGNGMIATNLESSDKGGTSKMLLSPKPSGLASSGTSPRPGGREACTCT